MERLPSRLHVLHLTDVIVGGGAERVVLDIACGLDRTVFRSTVAISRMPRDWQSTPDPALEAALERLRSADVRILPLSRTSKVAFWEWLPLIKLIRRENVEVLHSHKFGANVTGMVIGWLCRLPVRVAHEHTWSYVGQPVRKLLDRHVVGRLSHRFVAVSEMDRDRMISVEHIPAAKVQLIRNGVQPVPSTGTDVRDELGFPPTVPLVLAVGMLRSQKAFDVLIASVSHLAHEFPDVQVVIAGGPTSAEPELPETLRRSIAHHGVEGHVHMLGRRNDVSDLMAVATVGVCCSDFEGAPLAVMEYMVAGLPVVASEVGGIPELIESGSHGLLVPPRDPQALAGAIAEILRDRELAATLSKSARQRAERCFTTEAMTADVARMYEGIQQGRLDTTNPRRRITRAKVRAP